MKDGRRKHAVDIPGDDRFVPFAITITSGDVVIWTNNDTDDHTVVSNDAINKIGPKVNQVVKAGTSFSIKFREIGQWDYYCRFHSHLDEFAQPVAPGCGPNGSQISGIMSNFQCNKGMSIKGNFGTPMTGTITILPK